MLSLVVGGEDLLSSNAPMGMAHGLCHGCFCSPHPLKINQSQNLTPHNQQKYIYIHATISMLHSYCSFPFCLSFCYLAGNHLPPTFSCMHSPFNSHTHLFLSYNVGSCYSYTDPKVLHSYKPSLSEEVQLPQFFFF